MNNCNGLIYRGLTCYEVKLLFGYRNYEGPVIAPGKAVRPCVGVSFSNPIRLFKDQYGTRVLKTN